MSCYWCVCAAQLYAYLMFYPSYIFFNRWHLSEVNLSFSQHLQCSGWMSSSFYPWWWAKVLSASPKRRSLRRIDKANSHLFIQLSAGCWHESEHELSRKGQALLDTWLAWQGCKQWWSFSITAQAFSQRCLWNCLTAPMTCYATPSCQINGSLWSALKRICFYLHVLLKLAHCALQNRFFISLQFPNKALALTALNMLFFFFLFQMMQHLPTICTSFVMLRNLASFLLLCFLLCHSSHLSPSAAIFPWHSSLH